MMDPNSSDQLEAIARQRGFANAETMMAWERQRSQSLQRSTTTTGPTIQESRRPNGMVPPRPATPVDERSWYQRLIGALGG